MRIRTKILVSHIVLLTTVTLACLAIVAALAFTADDRRRLLASHEQPQNINRVAAEANRLSEQIAELFILGGQEDDIIDAREALMERLRHQRELVEQERALAGAHGSGRARTEPIDEMEALIGEIDESRVQLQDHLAAGRREAAEQIYSRDFEHRLDRMLGHLIDDAIRRERDKVEDALASSERLSERSMALAIGLVFIVGTLGLGNTVMLNRTIIRPINALYAGAEAVGQGDLGHVIATRSHDELGNLAGRFNDMTRQLKDQRDSLLRSKATLAQQVDARTRELRERSEELEATNAKLRAIDASRANFFSDISHELRTPVTVLRGQAEVALRDQSNDADELRAVLGGIVRKAEQMGRLVDDLLFLARSETGSIMVQRNDVLLQDVLGDVLIDGHGLLRRDGVRILPSQPQEPLIVRGDCDRLRQAIVIALDNAVKLAPQGTAVEVELRRVEDRAVIEVRDEGPGFSQEDLSCAFTRFYRGKPTRAGDGLGLGLSIAKWIVEQHRGTIRIGEARNGGARVEISVPLASAPA